MSSWGGREKNEWCWWLTNEYFDVDVLSCLHFLHVDVDVDIEAMWRFFEEKAIKEKERETDPSSKVKLLIFVSNIGHSIGTCIQTKTKSLSLFHCLLRRGYLLYSTLRPQSLYLCLYLCHVYCAVLHCTERQLFWLDLVEDRSTSHRAMILPPARSCWKVFVCFLQVLYLDPSPLTRWRLFLRLALELKRPAEVLLSKWVSE